MPFVRKTYRGNKVWAEVDEQGRLVEQRGLVKIRYRQDDPRDYSARANQIGELPPPAPEAAGAPPAETPAAPAGAADPAAPPPKKPRVARPRKKKAAAAGAAAASDDAVVIIYADGSCFGNPGPAGVGVLLEWKGRTKEISRFIGDGTNNIAELTAIEVALLEVKNRELPVRVHTDSAYAIGVLSEGWKAKENRELIARIQPLLREFQDLRFVKVRGHAGDPRNERVDQLARDAITRRA